MTFEPLKDSLEHLTDDDELILKLSPILSQTKELELISAKFES